eukprot:c15805_g1_i1.p1 GENE.c15805_g1_i1~~c15805_g1_i1.p1  ORF type:complete len:770 (+),score=176.27 c15805_g1_i1:231-2540(+)
MVSAQSYLLPSPLTTGSTDIDASYRHAFVLKFRSHSDTTRILGFVIVSRFLFVAPMRQLCVQLVHLMKSVGPANAAAAISHLVHCIPSPCPSLRVAIQLPAQAAPVVISLPSETFPTPSLTLNILCLLSNDTLVRLWSALLLETRVLLITAQGATLLTVACDAMRRMFFPLEWEGSFVPNLPESMITMVEAPTPFIMGCSVDTHSRIDPPSIADVLVCDLDSGIILNAPPQIPLPDNHRLALIDGLSKARTPNLNLVGGERKTSLREFLAPFRECTLSLLNEGPEGGRFQAAFFSTQSVKQMQQQGVLDDEQDVPFEAEMVVTLPLVEDDTPTGHINDQVLARVFELVAVPEENYALSQSKAHANEDTSEYAQLGLALCQAAVAQQGDAEDVLNMFEALMNSNHHLVPIRRVSDLLEQLPTSALIKRSSRFNSIPEYTVAGGSGGNILEAVTLSILKARESRRSELESQRNRAAGVSQRKWEQSETDSKILNGFVKWVAPPRNLLEISIELYSRLELVLVPLAEVAGEVMQIKKKNLQQVNAQLFKTFVNNTAELQTASVDHLSQLQLLCAWLNIHNIMVAHAVLADGGRSQPLNVLRRAKYKISGMVFSQPELEHAIIRGYSSRPSFFASSLFNGLVPKFPPNDPQLLLAPSVPRVAPYLSFGIFHATASSAPLRVFQNPDTVYADLVSAAEKFLLATAKVDERKRVISVPRVIIWYTSDVEATGQTLSEFVYGLLKRVRSVPESAATFSIAPLQYNWNVSVTFFPST